MTNKTVVRSLAGALLVCGSAYADGTGTLPSINVKVTNTSANPVPTAAQGTTHVAGVVDVLSAPPITGSVSVNNEPTVNLAPGSAVAVSGSVNVANQPTVNLASGSSVEISGTPSVNLAGTPTVSVSGLQFDSAGNLKVTGATGSAGTPGSGQVTTRFMRESLSGIRPGFPVRSLAHATADFAKVRVHVAANDCTTAGAFVAVTVLSLIDQQANESFVLDQTGNLCATGSGTGSYDAVFDLPGTEIQFELVTSAFNGAVITAFGR